MTYTMLAVVLAAILLIPLLAESRSADFAASPRPTQFAGGMGGNGMGGRGGGGGLPGPGPLNGVGGFAGGVP